MMCPSCGAGLPEDSLTCEYCGARTIPPERIQDKDTFRRIKESSQFRDSTSAERVSRLPKPGIGSKIFFAVFFTMFCGIALFIGIMMIVIGGAIGLLDGAGGFAFIPVCMGIFPLGMFGLGIYLAMSQFKKFQSLESGELTTMPAIVVGKRTMVSGGSGDSSASTSYFVTFEQEDGTREEYRVWDGGMYGRISEEDVGVLFLRKKYAVDFDRVRI